MKALKRKVWPESGVSSTSSRWHSKREPGGGKYNYNYKIQPKVCKVIKILMQWHWNAILCIEMHHLCCYHLTRKESQWGRERWSWWSFKRKRQMILLPGRRDEFKWKEAALSSILTRETDPSTPHNFSNLNKKIEQRWKPCQQQHERWQGPSNKAQSMSKISR